MPGCDLLPCSQATQPHSPHCPPTLQLHRSLKIFHSHFIWFLPHHRSLVQRYWGLSKHQHLLHHSHMLHGSGNNPGHVGKQAIGQRCSQFIIKKKKKSIKTFLGLFDMDRMILFLPPPMPQVDVHSAGTVEDPDSPMAYAMGPSACHPSHTGSCRVARVPAPTGLSHTRELRKEGAGKHQQADEEPPSRHLAAVVKQQGNH